MNIDCFKIEASHKRKVTVEVEIHQSQVKKIKKLKAITDSQAAYFINYILSSETIDLGKKADESSIDLLQIWSPRIMFLYVFLRDNEWDFDSYFTFKAKQAIRACFNIQCDLTHLKANRKINQKSANALFRKEQTDKRSSIWFQIQSALYLTFKKASIKYGTQGSCIK
jgi:hypothetical protein